MSGGIDVFDPRIFAHGVPHDDLRLPPVRATPAPRRLTSDFINSDHPAPAGVVSAH